MDIKHLSPAPKHVLIHWATRPFFTENGSDTCADYTGLLDFSQKLLKNTRAIISYSRYVLRKVFNGVRKLFLCMSRSSFSSQFGEKLSTLPGLEPGIPWFVVRCLIHWATRPYCLPRQNRDWTARKARGSRTLIKLIFPMKTAPTLVRTTRNLQILVRSH